MSQLGQVVSGEQYFLTARANSHQLIVRVTLAADSAFQVADIAGHVMANLLLSTGSRNMVLRSTGLLTADLARCKIVVLSRLSLLYPTG